MRNAIEGNGVINEPEHMPTAMMWNCNIEEAEA